MLFSRLNQSLKTEYETQLGLFQDLKGKYEEKVTLLQSENRRLQALTNPSASTEEPLSSKLDGAVNSENPAQSHEGNVPQNKISVLAEASNSTNNEEDSLSHSDVMDKMVNNKSGEENNVVETEAHTVDIVKEDAQVPIQQEVNTADTVNTATTTENGAEILTVNESSVL